MIEIDQIALNETKVIIRPGFAHFSKDFWLYSEKWEEQDVVQGKNLVIGGVYTVCKIEEARYIYLQDRHRRYTAKKFAMLARELVLASDFKPCLFKVGDMVKPSGRFNYPDLRAELDIYCDIYFSDKTRANKVTGVLNNRYIFIDCEPLSDYSLPFPWDDFVLAV